MLYFISTILNSKEVKGNRKLLIYPFISYVSGNWERVNRNFPLGIQTRFAKKKTLPVSRKKIRPECLKLN